VSQFALLLLSMYVWLSTVSGFVSLCVCLCSSDDFWGARLFRALPLTDAVEALPNLKESDRTAETTWQHHSPLHITSQTTAQYAVYM
jgi:hypothetical protein